MLKPLIGLESRRLSLPTLFGSRNQQPVPNITIDHPEPSSAALTPLDGVVRVVGLAFNKPRELTSTARRSRCGPSTDSRLFPSLETERVNGSNQIDGVQTLPKKRAHLADDIRHNQRDGQAVGSSNPAYPAQPNDGFDTQVAERRNATRLW